MAVSNSKHSAISIQPAMARGVFKNIPALSWLNAKLLSAKCWLLLCHAMHRAEAPD